MNDTAMHLGRLAERVVRMEPRRVKQALLDEIVLALRAGEKAILDRLPDPNDSRDVGPANETEAACTCLSISRDPLCVHHGDVDKVASLTILTGRK